MWRGFRYTSRKPFFMNKIAILLILSASLIFNFSAKAQVNQKGNIDLRAGVAGPNWFGVVFNTIPNGTVERNSMVPLTGSINYYFDQHFSLGIYSTFFSAKSDLYNLTFHVNDTIYVEGTGGLQVNRFLIGLRPEVHLGSFEYMDPYIGATVAARLTKFSAEADLNAEYGQLTDQEIMNSVIDYLVDLGFKSRKLGYPLWHPSFGVHAGIKYHFTPNVGAFVEVGLGGIPLGSGGLVVKF